jgi:Sensors of blue-light using FAD
MMIRMLYVSTAAGPVTTAVTGTILRSAQAHNAANGITGVLCQGQGLYLQVLEGERSAVEALYARIQLDKRHTQVEQRHLEEITRRRYGKWSMAHVDWTPLSIATNEKLPGLDPYTANGEQVMAQIDALIAAGKVLDAPVV